MTILFLVLSLSIDDRNNEDERTKTKHKKSGLLVTSTLQQADTMSQSFLLKKRISFYEQQDEQWEERVTFCTILFNLFIFKKDTEISHYHFSFLFIKKFHVHIVHAVQFTRRICISLASPEHDFHHHDPHPPVTGPVETFPWCGCIQGTYRECMQHTWLHLFSALQRASCFTCGDPKLDPDHQRKCASHLICRSHCDQDGPGLVHSAV